MLDYARSPLVRIVAQRRDIGMRTAGKIDEATFVDGEPGIVKQRHATDVPRGAPFFVRGWVVDLGRRDLPWDIGIEVDGRPFAARVARGDPRPEIARDLGTQAVLACGFRAYFETSGLRPGPHALRVRAVVGRRGTGYATIGPALRFFVHDRYWTRCAPQPRGTTPWFALDPVGPIATGEILVLSGWALDERGAPLRRVAARIDADPWNAGWVGIRRPPTGAPRNLARAGFCVRIRLDTTAPGSHAVRLAGMTAGGAWIALGAAEHLTITHRPDPLGAWLRPLLCAGEAVVTTVDGVDAAAWSVHTLRRDAACTVTGVLRRVSPPGRQVALIARPAAGGVECAVPGWSAPTSDPNVMRFGARIASGTLDVGAYDLFVAAPDAGGRFVGRAATECRLIVSAPADRGT